MILQSGNLSYQIDCMTDGRPLQITGFSGPTGDTGFTGDTGATGGTGFTGPTGRLNSAKIFML